MFFKKSQLKKEKEKATELIRLAQKVYDYRRDLIEPNDLKELEDATRSLEEIRKKKDISVAELKAARARLHIIAKKTGDKIYPVNIWADNSEMILVAAILALGIRTFFLQPFTIPTNSMYPSFYGMTSEVYKTENQKPSLAKRIFRSITIGASNYDIKAPTSGEVSIPLFLPNDPLNAMGAIRFEKVTGWKWFILPTPMRQYILYVGDKPAKIIVPWDFRLEDIVQQTYYPDLDSFNQVLEHSSQSRQIILVNGVPLMKTGKTLSASQSILDFDILSGDMLFVDRFSYHFRYPKVGEPFVFKAINIEGMRDIYGKPEDKYFIKRLAGVGGDVIEIKEPTLYRNGAPITGAPAFGFNSKQEAPYTGYKAYKALAPGLQEKVPQGYFYALGDNSSHSSDSRYWGFVPEKEVIGRAVFIFYPFTKRWGIAQ